MEPYNIYLILRKDSESIELHDYRYIFNNVFCHNPSSKNEKKLIRKLERIMKKLDADELKIEIRKESE